MNSCLKLIASVGFSLFFALAGFAQQKSLAELNKHLKNETNPAEKAKLFEEISKKIKQTQPDSAILLNKLALDFYNSQINKFKMAVLNISLAQLHIAIAQYQVAKSYNDHAFKLSQLLENDSLTAECYYIYGSYYHNRGYYDKGIENAYKCLRIFEKQQNSAGIIKSKGMLAQIYQLKNDLPRAEKILIETINYKGILKNDKLIAMHTLANVYGMEGKYKEALALDDQALALCNKKELDGAKSMFYDNMANCYMFTKKYKLAEAYFLKSFKIDSALDYKKQNADTYLNLGNLYLLQHRYPLAIAKLQQSIALSNLTGYRQGAYQAYLLLAEAYKKNNLPDSAYSILQKGYTLKDSIISQSSENKILELETLYQTEKKEQQLILQQTKLNQQNYFLGGLMAVIAAIIILGIFLYRRNQYKNKFALQQRLLAEQEASTKAILIAEEKERTRISAELHDGVGQLMSAVKMNLSAFENEFNFTNSQQKNAFNKLINLVDEGCKEVRNVSHQMMPGALLKYGLEKALTELINQIDQKILKINLHTEGLLNFKNNYVDNILFRIIQEAVNNTLKHARATSLDISLVKDNAEIRLSIEDNGIGFNQTQKKHIGIGLQNIHSRVQYLKGTIDVVSKENEGTLLAIYIPLN